MRNVLILLFLVSMAVIGCSGSSSPVTPSAPGNTVGSMENIPIIGAEMYEDGSFNAMGLLGAYELRFDPSTQEAELVSMRFPSLGQSWLVSGMNFFTVTPCHDCLKLGGISMDVSGNMVLKFSIRHPFAAGDPSRPPSGTNRSDLDVFDLAMVVVPVGATKVTYTLTGKSIYPIMVNNAGYTTELAKVTADTTAAPYVLVVDDNAAAMNSFNKFAQGDSKNFDAIFSTSALTSDITFRLYLTMGYGLSAQGKLKRLTPTYFNPEFNRKSAWKVRVTPPQGTNPPTQANTWIDQVSTAPFNVKVEVWDWQQGVTSIHNPPVTPTDIAMASDVASVSVEIPGMTAALPSLTTPLSGTGSSPSDPLIFQFAIMNENLLPAGQYTSLVRVADERAPRIGMPPPAGAIDYLIQSESTGLASYAIPEFATYQTFTATVVSGCGPLTGIGKKDLPAMCPVTIRNGGSVTFKVSGMSSSYATVTYYADFDWDSIPANFNKDASTTTGTFAAHVFTNSTSAEVTYTVGFKAEDSCNPPNQYFFTPKCQVKVRADASPVGNVILTVQRLPAVVNYEVNSAQPWVVSWAAAPNAYEYAIYYDTSPTDGLTNSLTLATTTTWTSWVVSSTHLPTNRVVPGYTYVIRSRSIIGDASSENPIDSEPAHIIVAGFESGTLNSNTAESWTGNCEINDATYNYRPFVSATYPANGLRSFQFSQLCSSAWSNRWNGMMLQMPVVPNSSIRRMECCAAHFQTQAPQGLIFGTSPTAPVNGYGFATPSIIEWCSVDATSPFTTYNTNSNDVRNFVSGVPAITPSVAWTNAGGLSRYCYASNLNVDGDPTDTWAVIEFFSATYSGGVVPNIYVDDVTIAIY